MTDTPERAGEFDNGQEELTDEEMGLQADFPVSAEPELVVELTNEEAEKLGLGVSEGAQEEAHLTSIVCDMCLELNLTTKASIISCERCGRPFCYHFTSNIDTRFCVNCMSDVSVTKQTITKEYVHRDEQENVTSVYRRNAREIKISGCDWLFMQRKIVDMKDLEVDLAIEFHRNSLMLMIDEQERRRTARMHRYAQSKVKGHIPTASDGSVTVSNTTSTTVKKSRTLSKDKATEQLNALLNSRGISLKDIEAALKAAGK